MLLRSDEQVALDDVIVACRKAADDLADAADQMTEPTLAQLFRTLSEEHDDMADALCHHLRRMGDLPSTPDPDAETLGQLVAHVRAALSPDERLEVLAERQEAEAEIARRVEAAMQTKLPPDAAEEVRRTGERVADVRRRLDQARQALGD